MELGFDKEIDAILRKAREGEAVFAKDFSSHLDADEIAAFAENALPEKAKMRSVAHLAGCDRCRKILSNLITLNAETESEIVHAEESVSIVGTAIPWYRKLFAFPNLAYSLGALVLVFGALIAFTVLQNSGLRNAEVSQVSNKPFETKSAPAQSNANTSLNMSNSATANAPAPAEGIIAANTAPHTSLSSNVNAVAAKPPVSADATPADAFSDDADLNLAKAEAEAPVTVQKQRETAEEAKRAEVVKEDAQDKKMKNERRNQQQPVPAASGAALNDSAKTTTRKDSAETGERTSVGGKVFRREGSAWIDSAYQQGSNMMVPSLENVTRGSNEYKKLDKDLRRIAEKLDGVVIIIWKSKGYRIQ